jgi:hypothetical protein
MSYRFVPDTIAYTSIKKYITNTRYIEHKMYSIMYNEDISDISKGKNKPPVKN